MKVRKTRDVTKTLTKKGFELHPQKAHHNFYYLVVDGKKHSVYTYVSHGKDECDKFLMSQIKKQLKFDDIQKAEDFFDCPMSKDQYVQMLKENGQI